MPVKKSRLILEGWKYYAQIKKDPEQAIVKIEKLQQQIPNSYEGFRTKEELEKAGFK